MAQAESAALHRFLAHCRLLMAFQPSSGALLYEVKLGKSQCTTGWNVLHPPRNANRPTRYMYVGADGAKLTEVRPNVPDHELNHVSEPELATLEGTIAWKQLCKLRQAVESREANNPRLEEFRSHANYIAEYPVDGSADIVEQHLSHFTQHVQALSVGTAAVDEVFQPSLDLVVRYLMLRESGGHAAQVLDWMLRCASLLPSPIGKHTAADLWLLAGDHLAAVTNRLLSDRDKYSLSGFLDMTYLASLYGNTGYHVYTHLLDSEVLRGDEQSLIKRRRLVLDETLAHYAGPSLLHPITYMPLGIEEFAKSRAGFATADGIYPGAIPFAKGPVHVETVWKAMEEYSQQAYPPIATEDLVVRYSPVAEEVKSHVAEFLLTMGMGRAR